MQSSGGQKIGGPAAVIILTTLIMLGAMAFAVPPPRIEVKATGVERGYLVSHSRFSATLATNVAADGYTYLVIDLTSAGAEEGAHWSGHLDRVNEVQFPVWAWIELDSATEQEAGVLAQAAVMVEASAHELAKRASLAATVARKALDDAAKRKKGLTDEDAKKRIDELIKEHKQRLADAESNTAVRAEEAGKAAVRAEGARKAAEHASAEWKLKNLIPGLNLRGVYIVGPRAVARARQLARDNAALTVLPVVAPGSAAPDGPHAVAFDVDEFVEGAKGVDFPILVAADIGTSAGDEPMSKFEKIEALRSQVEGNYLVATISVAK